MRAHVRLRPGTVLPLRRHPPRHVAGVTLIEAMVVLAIVGILLATAVPGFAGLLASHRATTAAADLLQAFTLARSEALRRSHRVYVAPLGPHWRDGWVLFVDRNDDRLFEPLVDEALGRHDALSASTSVTNPATPTREPFTDLGAPPRTYVSFDATGYPRHRNGGFLAGSMTITDHVGSAVAVRTLCLAAYGRMRIVQRTSC